MPRLFIGVFVDTPRLEAIKQELDPEGLLRWHHPLERHITFRFLGEQSCERAHEIANLLRQHPLTTPRVTLKGVAHFHERILYAQVLPLKPLKAIRQELDQLLLPIIQLEEHSFIPHLTLARAKHRFPSSILTAIKQHAHTPFGQSTPGELKLIESSSRFGTPRYRLWDDQQPTNSTHGRSI